MSSQARATRPTLEQHRSGTLAERGAVPMRRTATVDRAVQRSPHGPRYDQVISVDEGLSVTVDNCPISVTEPMVIAR